MAAQENQALRVLKDTNKKGKNRNWKGRKLSSIELAKRLEQLGFRSFERVYQCANVLKFVQQADGTKKLYQSYFCKNKLCVMCNWRRSMKYSYQAEKIVEEAIIRHPKGRFLFLTLTVKNVKGEELNQILSKMTEGFRRLMLYKKVDKNILGFLRATEVTYSKNRQDYHPHLHVLLFVKSTYFSGRGDNYITQEEWVELWQKAMKLDYMPMVDIRAVKSKEGKGINGAILETAKYPIKPFDQDKDGFTEIEKLRMTEDLVNGLHRKRQIGFGKLFKEIKKELQFDDLENGNLIKTSDDDTSVSKGVEIVAVWNWDRKNYFMRL